MKRSDGSDWDRKGRERIRKRTLLKSIERRERRYELQTEIKSAQDLAKGNRELNEDFIGVEQNVAPMVED